MRVFYAVSILKGVKRQKTLGEIRIYVTQKMLKVLTCQEVLPEEKKMISRKQNLRSSCFMCSPRPSWTFS